MAEAFKSIAIWLSTGIQSIAVQGTVSLLLGILLLGIRKIVLRLALGRKESKAARLRWRKNSAYATAFVLLLLLFPIWLPSIQSMLAVIGIFGAGVLIVLKEVILNVAGWFYIILRRPFEEGNRISISGLMGDVIDMRMLEFSMMEVRPREQGGQSTGRVLHIPNSILFTQPMANSSKEFLFNWNELLVPLTTDSNWKKAVEILMQIGHDCIEEITSADRRIVYSETEYAIRYSNLTPGVYVEVRDGQIQITLRHLVEPRNARQIADSLWREILSRFGAEDDIVLAGGRSH